MLTYTQFLMLLVVQYSQTEKKIRPTLLIYDLKKNYTLQIISKWPHNKIYFVKNIHVWSTSI